MASGSSAVAGWFSAARDHHRAGRLKEAEELYRRVLDADRRHAEATHALGVLALETGRLRESLELLRRAVMLSPLVSLFHCNLAEALRRTGDLQAAAQAATRAVQIDPQSGNGYLALGSVLRDATQYQESAVAFLRAIERDPTNHRAYNNVGNVLGRLGKKDQALDAYARGAAAAPNSHEILVNWALSLQEWGRASEALPKAQQAVQLAPRDASARHALWRCAGTLFDPDDLGRADSAVATLRTAAGAATLDPQTHSSLLFMMLHEPAFGDDEVFRAHTAWAARHAPPLAAPRRHERDASVDRPLRIGYVSPDLREHPVTYFIEPLLANHTRDFEVFLYSNLEPAQHDPVTARIKSYGHTWREVAGIGDAQLARVIDEHDRIDILVDLAGHTANHRLRLFGGKPAPVQVTYLGYQATTGLSAIDYRLTDSLVDPPGLTEPFHTEQLRRLDAFMCYRPPDFAPDVAPLPMLVQSDRSITFGSYCKVEKISRSTLDLWAAVLKRVPNARMIAFAFAFDDPAIVRRFLELMAQRGVEPGRLQTVGRQPLRPYLQSHERVDVILDTTPFSGHTTTCHALWMGVPTITLAGGRYASRMGLAVMTHLGLSEFVAQSLEQFVDIADRLAGEPDHLAELRRTMRGRMNASPLLDAARFTDQVEGLYRQIWNQQREM
jgi:predicted O-linked N-acetylglucosamine transferase (SPINDLY family)